MIITLTNKHGSATLVIIRVYQQNSRNVYISGNRSLGNVVLKGLPPSKLY